MKKLFLSLFVLGGLTFGLQSCDEDPCEDVTCAAGEICDNGDCVADPNAVCDVCGTYDGSADGDIQIALTGTDTSFTDLALTATVTESGSMYNMAVDISAILGAAPGTLVPDVDGSLSGNTITITNESYVYSGIATITINGDVNFNTGFTEILPTSELVLTGDATGTINFEGVKQ